MKSLWQIVEEPFKHNTETLLCWDPIMPYRLRTALSPCQISVMLLLSHNWSCSRGWVIWQTTCVSQIIITCSDLQNQEWNGSTNV